MNIKDCQYFQKLSELKNFSDTARYFHVSQPTITYSLKRLEDEYGVKLVDRKSYANSLTLTHSGEQLLTHIKRILREDYLTKQDLARIKEKKIKMGLPPIITNYLLPEVFDQLRDENLLDLIEPVVDGSKELLEELKKGHTDISLLGTTQLPEDAELKYEVIKTHYFKLIASSKRNFNGPIDLTDLLKEDFILTDNNSVHRQVFKRFTDRYNVIPKVIFETSDHHLLLNLIKANKGISFIAETALYHEEGIQEVEVNNLKLPPFYILVIYRTNTLETPDFRKIIDIFTGISTDNKKIVN
ncbi:LysR family transcriptional regulator [Companilactobacillus allii]|uniref:Malolactic fermentation transcriptional regulator n=1 Tax=Companilactobacillus allii TaxID=1847728 RepID=A0A1P8Q522_9LACO|nr:LysR family transcriptional regulator [Companilactobacillus allii]APX72954.1 malolactic fermentation transcriptional regulator [Companilactobacillus allii]USQ67746.1 LysR family transcriptional regulator [Companilactobacillus allii]